MGASFLKPAEQVAAQLRDIRAFVFDWDGVFNNARKNVHASSDFNEVDSMGTNMMRFNHYLHQKKLPGAALISGEKNELAFSFSRREHFNACYYNIKHKIQALEHFCESEGIKQEEVCFFFDDVLDLSIAERCGMRVLINRKSSPLFKNYVIKNKLAEYITASETGGYAVREACEMIMGLHGTFDRVMDERKAFSPLYAEFFEKRQAVQTKIFKVTDGKITED